jgi:septal ring factor EnvC (AmiA/AmiB activator)
MKIFIIFILTCFIFGSISTNIRKTNNQIKSTNKKYKSTYYAVRQTRSKLKKAKKELAKIKYEIKKLTKNKTSFNALLKQQDKILENKKKQKELLEKNINDKEKAIISNLVKDMSFITLFSDKHSNDSNEFVKKNILKKYMASLNSESKEKSHKLNIMLNELKKKRKNIKNIEQDIASIKKKINKKKNLEANKEKAIKAISSTRISLDKSMRKIKNKEKELRNTLSRLNILKRNKERKKYDKRIRNDNKKVRQVNSSYSSVPVLRYRGRKTISPLKRYKLIKKFGSSYDDIYNMKTFNEFIVLKSPIKSQKVLSVLAGRVVLAEKMPTLDKTVIIKHSNGIHTIYANLSVITPSLRKGKYIKKGFAVGKVDDELKFEVTKNNKLINPNRFIRLKR